MTVVQAKHLFILQQLYVGKDLGMIFLLSVHIVLTNLIYVLIFESWSYRKNSIYYGSYATDALLEFLDLELKFDKESKQIYVDVFAKDTESFTYVLPSTCFPKNNIENISKSVALCLRRICDSDEKFGKHSAEYQDYLIARDYKAGKVKKQFFALKNLLEKRQENLNYLSYFFYFMQFDYII